MLTWFATFGSLLGSAIALFAAVLATRASLRAHKLAGNSAHQAEHRARSEETMRMLRWGVELAVADQPQSVRAGIAVLGALADARIVIDGDRDFIFKVARGVTIVVGDHDQYAVGDNYEDAPFKGGVDA